jgi:hypothetical protein
MKVKMFDKEWNINSINYKQKRELWHLSLIAFDNKNTIQDKYFEMINKVEEYSGLTEDDYTHKDKSLLSMAEIDLLLQEVYSCYMGIEKKDS